MALTEKQINRNAGIIINSLQSINRPGMETLIEWMTTETDFFTAPASTKYHGSFKGGLAQHSLNVYSLINYKLKEWSTWAKFDRVFQLEYESMILVSLLHDLCKVGKYKRDVTASKAQINYVRSLLAENSGCVLDDIDINNLSKNQASSVIEWFVQHDQDPDLVPDVSGDGYMYLDKFDLGHGEKSVILLQRFVDLFDIEILMIRYHMATFNDDQRTYRGIKNRYPIVHLFHLCDEAATLLEENDIEPSITESGELVPF